MCIIVAVAVKSVSCALRLLSLCWVISTVDDVCIDLITVEVDCLSISLSFIVLSLLLMFIMIDVDV